MRPIKSSLKTTTVSHLYLQILSEQEILAWHKRLFKNRFAGEAQYRLCEKTLGFFFCKRQAQKNPLATSLLATSFPNTLLGQWEGSSAPSAEGLPNPFSKRTERQQPTPVQTGSHPPAAASFLHTP